ncbi:aluminum-activated malate transporter 12-like [Macadamia integrifolia]|uniref:aluminum-activated malate transporter 12-like n=1 Tax=Macadamia integrifolia TaxID=60698 RepID=UPI001C4F74C6|nr:aluminum-activated malate transporter 12-like [Macadamia integrifolia]
MLGMNSSTVVALPVVALSIQDGASTKKKNMILSRIISSLLHCLTKMKAIHENRNLIHSIKVGLALVLVSLLYFLDPLFEEVGDNAMWAIMTVVVVFEFYAGATLGKGINRGIGTIVGGGLGCSTAILAQNLSKIGKASAIGTSVFFFGAAATYTRLIPSIRKRYDYGAMIFILTFNLVVVSGVRADKVIQLARDRLSTIGMGFAVCVSTSLLIFPVWASDELHSSTASKFNTLACSIEGCLEEYFKGIDEKKDNQSETSFKACRSVLHSKSTDESLANFARWEPWHGKFGFSYPWHKYLQIGDSLRELAASILSLKGCLQSHRQPTPVLTRHSIKKPCEAVVSQVAYTLRTLGDSIINMKRSSPAVLMVAKLQLSRIELSEAVLPCLLRTLPDDDGFAMVGFVFLLIEMVDIAEKLSKEVEELADYAGFPQQLKYPDLW